MKTVVFYKRRHNVRLAVIRNKNLVRFPQQFHSLQQANNFYRACYK